MLWEAQFGDFANSGQVIIDSFIASGESKWGLTSRMTLLLPHGHEGAGPEHSSARLERFLSLAAEGNMRIANPSTAAQYFHLLRRQALIKKPRPLIVFTPKGQLRQPAAAATLDQLTDEHFHFILDDPRTQAGAGKGRAHGALLGPDLLRHRRRRGPRVEPRRSPWSGSNCSTRSRGARSRR